MLDFSCFGWQVEKIVLGKCNRWCKEQANCGIKICDDSRMIGLVGRNLTDLIVGNVMVFCTVGEKVQMGRAIVQCYLRKEKSGHCVLPSLNGSNNDFAPLYLCYN